MNSRFPALILGAFFAGTAAGQTSPGAQSAAGAQSSATQQTSVQPAGGGASAQSAGGASGSANAPAQAGQNSANFAGGTAIQAELTQSLDASKCKPGDRVVAKTTQAVKSDGKTVIPKGSRLVGHVTEAQARAKGEAQSSLGIVFDHAVLKDGSEVPVNATIQSVAAAQSALAASDGSGMFASDGAMGSRGAVGAGPAPRASGGLVGGVTSAAGGAGSAAGATVASTTNATSSAAAGTTGAALGGSLNSTTSGVAGLPGLSLTSAPAGGAQGSVLTSTTRNVHLDSGTQMLLVTQAQSGSAPSRGERPAASNPKPGRSAGQSGQGTDGSKQKPQA